MANVFYTNGKARIIGGNPGSAGTINLLTDTIKMILVTSGYTPAAAHNTIADLGANEVAAGGGYTTGGVTLTSKAISTETSNTPPRAYFTAGSVNWASSTISAAYAVLYKYTGGTYSSEVMIGCYDFGGTKSSSSGNFTVQPDATDGYLYL